MMHVYKLRIQMEAVVQPFNTSAALSTNNDVNVRLSGSRISRAGTRVYSTVDDINPAIV